MVMVPSFRNASLPLTTTTAPQSQSGISNGEIFTLTVMLLVSTSSLAGNLLVISAAYLRESLRTPNNLLLVNLALADLGQGIVAMPLRITEIFNRGTEPLVPCLFVLYVTILFFGVSMITVALISTDRFIAIKWPFLYPHFLSRRIIVLAGTFTWLFMLVFAAIPYMGSAVTPVVTTKFCFYTQYLSQAYLLAMFAMINIFIIVILLFTNTYLLRQTLRHISNIKTQVVPMSWEETFVQNNNIGNINNNNNNNNDNKNNRNNNSNININNNNNDNDNDNDNKNKNNSNNNNNNNNNNININNDNMNNNINTNRHNSIIGDARSIRAQYHREIKATKVTLAVVGFTVILTTPIMVIDLVSIWCPTCSPSVITRISIAMAYANSCVNPWIFAGFNKLYRQTYLEVLRKIRDFLLCKRTS